MAGSKSERAVTFYFGLGSRYSYLAATQISALEKDYQCTVAWRPLLSQELMTRRGQNPFSSKDRDGNWAGAATSGQYTEAYRQEDLKRWAAHYGVAYHEPPPAAMDARRRTLYCVAADLLGRGGDFSMAIFRAIYVEVKATTEANCRNLAASLGLDADQLSARVDDGNAIARHEAILSEAISAGIFGVPSFVWRDQLFFGNDRIVLLKDALKAVPC